MVAVGYEYKVLEVHKAEELEKRLNEGALEGWELDRVFMAAAWGGGMGSSVKVWVVLRRPVK